MLFVRVVDFPVGGEGGPKHIAYYAALLIIKLFCCSNGWVSKILAAESCPPIRHSQYLSLFNIIWFKAIKLEVMSVSH